MLDNDTFGCSDVGNNTVTLTVTDVNGNSSSCMAMVTVEDNIPPTINCPMDVMAATDPGECSAIVVFADAIAIDNCGVASVVQTDGPASGSMFPIGDTTIEYTATDVNGNTNVCTFTITVTDMEAPVAVCQDITLEIDPVTGVTTIVPGDVDGGSTDNCGIASLSLDNDTFTCADVGVNVVTLTVTDDEGNSSDCTANVTIQDTTAPVLTCIGQPGTISDTEDFEGAGVPAGWSTNVVSGSFDWMFGSGDMPVGGDFASNAAIFDDDAIGPGETDNTVQLLSPVYDMTGAVTGDLSFEYAHQDFAGSGEFTVDVWDGSTWQQILFVEVDTDPTVFGPIDIIPYANSAFQVRFQYDDEDDWAWGAGVDNFAINFDVPATPLDVVLDANGNATINASDLLLSVDEACGWTATAGSTDSLSITTTFAGGNGFNGNMFDMNAINDITVQDFDVHLDPGVTDDVEVYFKTGSYVGSETTPGDWTLIATAVGVSSAGANTPTPLGLSLGVDIDAGNTGAFYVTTVNGGGMAYTNGTTPGAVFVSDANLEFLEGAGKEYPFAATFEPRVFNGNIYYDVDGVSTTIDLTCANLGENQIEITVTDDSGNVATCIGTVNVLDETDPILVCQDVTLELGPDGTLDVDPMDLLANAPDTFDAMIIGSDNGSGTAGTTDFTVSVTANETVSFDWDYSTTDTPGFDSFGYLLTGVYTLLADADGQSGNTTVNLTAGDVFGFRSETTDNVFGGNETMITNFTPGFDGQFEPANWTLDLNNSDGDAFFITIPGGPLSFDACGITVLAVDVVEVTCDDIGTPITATVFASDASGNLAACNSVITVVDALGPEVTCPADQTVDPGPGNLFYEVPDYWGNGDATASDNCTDPLTIFTQDPAPGTEIPDGVYTVTLCSTDEYGNETCCTFELTVESVLGVDSLSLDSGVVLYPNPANDIVNIANQSNVQLDKAVIYDMGGRLVQTVDLSDLTTEKAVDVSQLASGTYMVQITGETGQTVKQLIKQ